MAVQQIDTKEVQQIELGLLRVFAQFCKDHDLTYYLAYGTLLGAIRHQGFIPWDDDIDVLMPRPDYDRLASLLHDETLPDGIGIGSLDDPTYIFPYMKFYFTNSKVIEKKFDTQHRQSPIWMDIFPMDGVPSGKINTFFRFFLTKVLRNFLYTAVVNPRYLSGMERVGTIVSKPFSQFVGPHRIARWIDRFARQYTFSDERMIGNVAWGEGTFEAIEKELFLPVMDSFFEGEPFSIPVCFDRHLRDLYGDYMELPPVEERKSHLGGECIVYDLND